MAAGNVVPDRLRILRSRLLDREPLTGLTIKDEIGRVNYPKWFIELQGVKDRDLFRERILVNYTNLRPNGQDDEDTYVHRVNPFGLVTSEASEGPVYYDTADCTMCQFVTIAAFFPEICGTDIVEFAPIMGMGRHVIDGGEVNSHWIKLNSFRCPLCQGYLPGKYNPVYQPLVIKSAQGGETFPAQGDYDYNVALDDQFGYERILLSMIPRNSAFILMNCAARDILANSVGRVYCKAWSLHFDQSLWKDHWRFTHFDHKQDEWSQVRLPTFSQELYDWYSNGKRKADQSDVGRNDYWSPNGTATMLFMLVGWYRTDPLVLKQEMESNYLAYALTCIANCDG